MSDASIRSERERPRPVIVAKLDPGRTTAPENTSSPAIDTVEYADDCPVRDELRAVLRSTGACAPAGTTHSIRDLRRIARDPPAQILARAPAWNETELKRQEMMHALQRAGLSVEDASTLITRGVTDAEATDMLSLELMQPDMPRYGVALLAMRILSEARAAGALSATAVAQIFDAHRSMLVLRPDGVLADVVSGEPVERVKKLGKLELGATYHVRDGVLFVHDGEYRPTSEIVRELSLHGGAVGAALDGAEDAFRDLVVGTVELIDALIERPEETLSAAVDGFGRIPQTIATLIRQSPEMLEQFRNLPEHDRIRAIGNLTTQLLLAAAGAASASGAAGQVSKGISGLRLAEMGAQVSGFAPSAGRSMVLVGAESLALTAYGGARGGFGLYVLGSATSSVADVTSSGQPRPALDARTQWKTEDRVRRSYPEFHNPEARLQDLEAALDLVERTSSMGPNELAHARDLVLARLEKEAAHGPIKQIPELARVAKKAGAEVETKVRGMLDQRIRDEVHAIRGLDKDRKGPRIQALRAAADEAGIDLNVVLRNGAAKPPFASLSAKAQKAIRDIERGKEDVHVDTRQQAEELLSWFPKLVDTGDWGWPMIKGLLRKSKHGTFHWDELFGPDGRLVGHPPPNDHGTWRHLQLHTDDGTFRIRFGKEGP